TALSNDDDKEAASGGEAMVAAMNQLDKSVLTAEQAALYNQNEADLKEHAEHIGENVGNIKHQREHFIMMSEDVYALVKGFRSKLRYPMMMIKKPQVAVKQWSQP